MSVPRLLKGRVLRGGNLHHGSTVFSQRVDLGGFAGFPVGEAGLSFEQALLEAVLEVERDVARTMRRVDSLRFATIVRDASSPGVVDLVWECHAGSLSRAAARVALAGLLERMPAEGSPVDPGSKRDFSTLRKTLQRRARRRQWSTRTAALVLAARERGIPCESLAGEYLRLGEGVLQHVISESAPGEDSAAALEAIFPTGAHARVPAALIVGERRAASIARNLDGLLRASGIAVGLATRKLTTISGKPVDPTSLGRGDGARFLLGDPRVERLVYALSPRRVVERGLRLDHATVTAVLDPKVGGDAEAYRRGIDVAVAATTGLVVVGADNPHAERLARDLGPERLVLIAPRRRGPAVRRHLAEGGRAVVVKASGSAPAVELRRSSETNASVPMTSLRAGAGRTSESRIRRAMFTMALASGLGLSGAEIVAAFRKRRFLRR